MSIWATAMCMLGRHTGQWSPPDDRCESVRACLSCGTVDVRKRHPWGGFEYLTSDRCDQRRQCHRCDSTQARVQHAWGGWRYRNEQQHTGQVRTCTRCGEQQRTRYTLRQA